MASIRGSRRYAQAILEIAEERQSLDRWRADLETLDQILSDPALRSFLDNPRFDFATKREAVSGRLNQVVSPEAVNLTLLLIQRNRLDLIPGIAEEFRRLSNERLGIADALVTTAIPLDEDERRLVRERLEAVTGRQINLASVVDPSIIGGFIARIGDQVIDGSTRTRLVALKRSLTGVGR